MKVYKITIEEANELRGKKMSTGATYNVDIRDANNNIIISVEQYNECLKGVEIDYEPVEKIEE